MFRWHQEVALLEKRLKLDIDSHRGNACGCERGMFRKMRPLGCSCSRKRAGNMCKIHKIMGNSRGAKTFQYIKELERAAVED